MSKPCPANPRAVTEIKMADEEIATNGERAITRTGDRLRKAREEQGLSLAEVAQRTRITQRHLRAVEESDFSELPGRTYVTGFARAYARAIGISETEIATSIRRELEDDHYSSRPTYEAYEPTDPARLPTKGLADGWCEACNWRHIRGAVGSFRRFSACGCPVPCHRHRQNQSTLRKLRWWRLK